MKFKNLKIVAKLGLGFGICVATTVFLGLFSIVRLGALDDSTKALQSDSLVAFQALSQMTGSSSTIEGLGYRHLATKDHAAKKEIESLIKEELTALHKSFDGYDTSIALDEDRKMFDALKTKWEECEKLESALVAASVSNDAAKQAATLKQLDGAYSTFRKDLEALEKWNLERADSLTAAADATYKESALEVWIMLAVAIIAAIASCFFVTRSVKLPLALVVNRMHSLQTICMSALRSGIEALAQGDLVKHVKTGTTAVPYESKDEIGQVASSFNSLLTDLQSTVDSFDEARSNLRALVGDVSRTADSVANSSDSLNNTTHQANGTSEEIAQTIQQVACAANESAQTSTQIASGSEQLAIGATEASAAMEKLDTAVQSVQKGSQDQQLAAAKANEIAMEGGQAVQQTISSMERISKQVSLSEDAIRELGDKQAQIGAIVQAIDEIAEQTNLLALNAAIEAARAGEHGRGFAVVAEEVRKLAERSSTSTKEIADLIKSVREGVEKAIESMTASALEVSEGSKSSDAAKAALVEILDGIANVQTLAEQNSQLVDGMASDARIVTDAISNVASVSEETAAGAQEMSASAEEMAAATQQAAAAVQEQTASIGEVSRMAMDLKDASAQLQSMVSAFKIDGESETPDLRLAA
ncbi:MAG: MCP four helix bundle domain-containing protein [Fimbriimonadaceae bacterium]|nr:MCP four helix bundle domain-containing protein [Fimbriimonadaceae bacterium]